LPPKQLLCAGKGGAVLTGLPFARPDHYRGFTQSEEPASMKIALAERCSARLYGESERILLLVD
jgi:hypothetical protein